MFNKFGRSTHLRRNAGHSDLMNPDGYGVAHRQDSEGMVIARARKVRPYDMLCHVLVALVLIALVKGLFW